MPESVGLIAKLGVKLLFVQKYAAAGFSSAHESALTSRPHVFALVGAH